MLKVFISVYSYNILKFQIFHCIHYMHEHPLEIYSGQSVRIIKSNTKDRYILKIIFISFQINKYVENVWFFFIIFPMLFNIYVTKKIKIVYTKLFYNNRIYKVTYYYNQ